MMTDLDRERLARKERSELILATYDVRINPKLPGIVTEAESVRRTAQQVADRLLALTIVGGKGEGIDDVVAQVIEERDAMRCFTPRERAFIEDPAPSEHDRTQFRWRYEAAWTLFWALNMDEDDPFGMPLEICDVSYMAGMVGNLPDLDVFGLKPQPELLDEADLIYRCHWAVRQASLDGTPPSGGLDPGVTMERHYALNWLIGYGDDAAWDEISTDT